MYNFNTVNNTTGEVTTYTWDCNNRLLGVNTAGGEEMGFVYDSAGMLIREEASGVERRIVQRGTYGIREQVRSGQDTWENSVYHIPVSEHTSHEGRDGQILASYIRPGKNRPDGGAIFYHPDHLGSVRLVTDEAGRIIDKPQTDAYGNPIPHKTATSTPGAKTNQNAKILQKFNFTGTHGIQYVEKIKMHNMRARWYGGSVGRFVAVDPYQKDKPNNITNRFVYANDNPLSRIDPNGLKDYKINVYPWYYSLLMKPKICKALNKIEKYLCPKISSLFEQIEYHITSLGDPESIAVYINTLNMENGIIINEWIELNSMTIGSSSENSLIYTLTHEFIHMKMTHDLQGPMLAYLEDNYISDKPRIPFADGRREKASYGEILQETFVSVALLYASEHVYPDIKENDMCVDQLTNWYPRHPAVLAKNINAPIQFVDPFSELLQFMHYFTPEKFVSLPQFYKKIPNGREVFVKYCK